MNGTDDPAPDGSWSVGIATAIVILTLVGLALVFLFPGAWGNVAVLGIGAVLVAGGLALFFVSILNSNWRRTLWSQKATIACITTVGVLGCAAIVLFFAMALWPGA